MRQFVLRLWWLWVFAIAAATHLLVENGAFRSLEARIYDALVGSAKSPGWPDDFVVVTADAQDGEVWNAERIAALVARLRELGARTVAIDAWVSPDDPTIAALAEHAEILVLAALPAPGAPPPAEDVRDAVLVPRGKIRTLPPSEFLEAFWLPSGPFLERSAIGHTARRVDADNVTRREAVLLPVTGEKRLLPSFPLAAFARHHDVDLAALEGGPGWFRLRGTVIRSGADGMLVDYRGGDDPLTVSADRVLRRSDLGDVQLRPVLDGALAMVVWRHAERDLALLPGGRVVPYGFTWAYGYRTLATGRPFAASSLPLLAGLVMLTLLLVRRWPAAPPIAVAGAALCVAMVSVTSTAGAFSAAALYVPVVPAMLFLVLAGLTLGVFATLNVERRLEKAESRADASTAPTGRVAFVFTDVQGSTRLWEKAPAVMRSALDLHNGLFRRFLEEERGYEVKTEGDAFMIAFADPLDAFRWCVDVQRTLVSLPWPPELATLPDAAEERDASGVVFFRGLRVRMGIHVGDPEAIPDPKSGRMDYFGPPVNRAARVSGAAHGGQILVSGDAWRALESRLVQAPLHRSRSLGEHLLKGLETPELLVEIVPEAFRARTFPPPKTETPASAVPKT